MGGLCVQRDHCSRRELQPVSLNGALQKRFHFLNSALRRRAIQRTDFQSFKFHGCRLPFDELAPAYQWLRPNLAYNRLHADLKTSAGLAFSIRMFRPRVRCIDLLNTIKYTLSRLFTINHDLSSFVHHYAYHMNFMRSSCVAPQTRIVAQCEGTGQQHGLLGSQLHLWALG